MKPANILIQQPVIAPYRLPVFLSISSAGQFKVRFIASDVTFTGETSRKGQASVEVSLVRSLRFPLGFVWQKGLSREIRSGKSILISLGYDPHYLSSIWAAMWARRHGVAVVLWGHGVHERSSRFATWLYARMARLADALVFYAEGGARACIDSGIDPKRVFVAWNSIDTSGIEGLRAPGRFELRRRVVLLGRLTEGKKPLLAIQAFALALPSLPTNTILTIIGDGPLREACIEEASRLGITDRVELTGAIYDDSELASFMNDAWICLSTGYVGLSAIHSLAFGVPMVYSRNEKHSPEVCALEVDTNALDFETDSVTDLARVLSKMSADRERCAEMGRNGMEVVKKRFSVEAMSATLIEAFQYAASVRKD